MNSTFNRSQILRATAWANRYLLVCIASFAAVLLGITLIGFAEHASVEIAKVMLYFVAVSTVLIGATFALMSLLAHDQVSRRNA